MKQQALSKKEQRDLKKLAKFNVKKRKAAEKAQAKADAKAEKRAARRESWREIGDALGLLPNTVDQKLSRALKRLRAIWKEEPNVYE